jgi:hypothetical protein
LFETARYIAKFDLFYTVLEQKMSERLIFASRTLNCVVYLHILEELFIPNLEEEGLYVLLKRGGAPAVSHIAAWDRLETALFA